ncbi:peptidylprolyl isomerase [Clostridium hydrogeniformans]|uniref:peptidylprolyl isomerase n=1 Tax=Clostridium hydrogeniformans TaxID=349933 RepID=UPI0004837366|nr:peptidylprolyl isomerase [Clostridium hydrogeniformans]
MENKILAIVNGVQILDKHLDEAIMRYPADRRQYLETPVGREQLLEQMISFELMYNYGKELGTDSSEEYLNQVEKAKKDLLTQIVIGNELSKVEISDDEAEKYYNDNKENFKEMEQVQAKHILVETEEEANEVAKKIAEGLSFEEAAQSHSSCPSSQNGGDLGFFTRGRMVPEFEEAAFKLNLGEVSAPVQTQFGFHLIKVEDKKEERVKPLEEVKEVIKQNLLQEKQNQRYFDLTEELKSKYRVEVYK